MAYYLRFLSLFLILSFAERLQFAQWHHLFKELSWTQSFSSIIYGIRFDLAVSSFLSFIIYFFSYLIEYFNFKQNERKVIIFGFSLGGLLVLTFIGDTIYYFDSGRHIGFESLVFFNDPEAMLQTAFYKFWKVFLWKIPVLIVFYFGLKYVIKTNKKTTREKNWKRVVPEARLLVLCFFSAGVLTNGFHMPDTNEVLSKKFNNYRENAMAANGAYNFLYVLLNSSKGIPELSVESEISRKEEKEIVERLYETDRNRKGSLKKYNIVILFLESWSSVKMENPEVPYNVTPFYNELKRKSLSVKGMFASGHRTAEGVFASLCSLQNPLGKAVARTQLENFSYRCLPEILKELGYRNILIQGTPLNMAGINVMVKKLGINENYGLADIKERKYVSGFWGAQDYDLYEFALKKMRESKTPFFIGINTNSTHNVYLPKGVKKKFPDGDLMLNVLNFADDQLRDFFQEVSKEKFFNKTIFVLVADHTNYVHSSMIHEYLIPFLIYAPGIVKEEKVNRMASQRDIAPTLLDILNYTGNENGFSGKSLLKSDEGPYFADFYHEGILGWAEGNRLVEIPISNSREYHCRDLTKSVFRPENKKCEALYSEIRKRAVAFTKRMQDDLFSGQTINFRKNP